MSSRAHFLGQLLAGAVGVHQRRLDATLSGALTLVAHSRTSYGAEQTTALPIHAGDPGGQEYQTILSLPLTVQAGDLIQVRAECEITNGHGYLTMIACQLALEDGSFLAGPMAEDVQPWCHYNPRRFGSLVATASGPVTVGFLVRGGSDWSKPGDSVRVEPGYGALELDLFR